MASPRALTATFTKFFPSGVLQREELVQVLGKLGDFDEPKVNLLWAKQAVRSDGGIEISAFLSYLWDDSNSQEPPNAGLRQLASAMASDEGKTELKALFDALDTAGTGKVSSKEWGHGLSKNKDLLAKYFGGTSLAELGKAFKRLDVDASKDLSWEEFVNASEEFAAAFQMADLMANDDGRAELKALFDALDTAGTGRVSSKEWGHGLSQNKDLLAKYFGGTSLAELGKAFKRLDVDRSKDLSWEEFTSAAAKLI
jgi:Ca2+-binding EF-hand superfamily protein